MDIHTTQLIIFMKEYIIEMSNNLNNLHKLKILSRITARNDLNNYDCVQLTLFVFNDEVTLKRKIRLQIM